VGRRALIIGIEDYPSVSDGSIDAKLPGTLGSALAFRDWLSAKWDAEQVAAADRQLIFCSEPIVQGGRPAARDDILQALLDLRSSGQNATEEFFFFFSGHGFSFVSPGARADMLIASNYKSMDLSGASACLNLDQTVYWLRQELGPGWQYYFVDACRNQLDGTKIAAGPLGLPNNPQTTGEATSFLLQSTIPAATAAVDGKFSSELMAGLKGRSTAKTWDETDADAMLVRYDTLRAYVRERMKTQRIYNKVEGEGGEADGIIARLKPAPSSKCEVRIEGSARSVSGFIEIVGRRTGRRRTALSGTSTQLDLKPDRYAVNIDLDEGHLRDNGREVTVLDDQVLTFQFDPVKSAPTFRESMRTFSDIVVPGGASIELHELITGERQIFRSGMPRAVPDGRYAATLRDRDDRVVKSDVVVVGQGQVVDVTDWSNSPPQTTIATRLPNKQGAVLFSETLAPVSDPDLGIWLALLGGGRILDGIDQRTYSKIAALPLHDFAAEVPGSSPLYLLAGFDDPATRLMVGVSAPGEGTIWKDAAQPGDLAGIRECYLPRQAGSQLVSLRIGDAPVYTVGSLASQNRATLMTLTLDEDEAPLVSQYLLPLGRLVGHLHPFIVSRLAGRNHLSDVKMLAQSVRAFRNRRDVSRSLPEFALESILNANWVDPVASALAAYELIRRGRTQRLAEVVHNLTTYFPELPDGAALTRRAGLGDVPYRPTPLFLDGLRAFEHIEQKLPLPAANLDYTSPWTAWREAR
jgi:hypothetical protein